MSIIAWLVVGILAGWLAERITGRNWHFDELADVAIGPPLDEQPTHAQ